MIDDSVDESFYLLRYVDFGGFPRLHELVVFLNFHENSDKER